MWRPKIWTWPNLRLFRRPNNFETESSLFARPFFYKTDPRLFTRPIFLIPKMKLLWDQVQNNLERGKFSRPVSLETAHSGRIYPLFLVMPGFWKFLTAICPIFNKYCSNARILKDFSHNMFLIQWTSFWVLFKVKFASDVSKIETQLHAAEWS